MSVEFITLENMIGGEHQFGSARYMVNTYSLWQYLDSVLPVKRFQLLS